MSFLDLPVYLGDWSWTDVKVLGCSLLEPFGKPQCWSKPLISFPGISGWLMLKNWTAVVFKRRWEAAREVSPFWSVWECRLEKASVFPKGLYYCALGNSFSCIYLGPVVPACQGQLSRMNSPSSGEAGMEESSLEHRLPSMESQCPSQGSCISVSHICSSDGSVEEPRIAHPSDAASRYPVSGF